MRTNTPITIFKRSIATGVETWDRYEVPAAWWEHTQGANIFRTGIIDANSITVYIPPTSNLPVMKSGDIIVKGIVPNEISATYTMETMRSEFETGVIRSVDDFTFGSDYLQHYMVLAS